MFGRKVFGDEYERKQRDEIVRALIESQGRVGATREPRRALRSTGQHCFPG